MAASRLRIFLLNKRGISLRKIGVKSPLPLLTASRQLPPINRELLLNIPTRRMQNILSTTYSAWIKVCQLSIRTKPCELCDQYNVQWEKIYTQLSGILQSAIERTSIKMLNLLQILEVVTSHQLLHSFLDTFIYLFIHFRLCPSNIGKVKVKVPKVWFSKLFVRMIKKHRAMLHPLHEYSIRVC